MANELVQFKDSNGNNLYPQVYYIHTLPTISIAGDLDSVGTWIKNNLTGRNNGWIITRVSSTSSGIFGTSAFAIIANMSSANYGFGMLMSDNDTHQVIFFRCSGGTFYWYAPLISRITNDGRRSSVNDVTITPQVGANYSNYGNSYYYKCGTKVHVHLGLSGLATGDKNTIFTLPATYRPRGQVSFMGKGTSTTMLANASISSAGVIDVWTTGTHACIDCEFDAYN